MLGMTLYEVSRVTTYKVQDTSRRGLVLRTLDDEEQTLTGLGSPGDGGVGDSGLLILLVGGELLGLDGVVAEVEEALGEAKAPASDEG